MKKKLLTICLVSVMAIMVIAGASLAYLTDTDNADNTFTVGNVKIDLVEQQRNADRTALEEFKNGKVLMPIVGSAQGEKDRFGLPTAKNWVDKVVDVKNTGNQNAYVRVIMAYPSEFGQTETASDMMLHWNIPENFYDYWSIGTVEEQVKIDGVTYDLFVFTYETALAPAATTATHALTGLYLDSRTECTVNEDDGSVTYTLPLGEKAYSATVAEGKSVQLKVFAQAIQAAGFDKVDEAFAASGLPTNPWANN